MKLKLRPKFERLEAKQGNVVRYEAWSSARQNEQVGDDEVVLQSITHWSCLQSLREYPHWRRYNTAVDFVRRGLLIAAHSDDTQSPTYPKLKAHFEQALGGTETGVIYERPAGSRPMNITWSVVAPIYFHQERIREGHSVKVVRAQRGPAVLATHRDDTESRVGKQLNILLGTRPSENRGGCTGVAISGLRDLKRHLAGPQTL